MASPFRLFRKHQKWMIATAGLIAIFAFVFADPITSWMQAGGPGAVNTVVASSSYGKISERQLDNMLHMRRIVNRFLEEAWNKGQLAGGRYDERPMPREESERAVVEDMLLAKKAEEMGFAVSNKVINDYLKAITGDALKVEQYEEIVDNLYTLDARSVTMAMVFDALRQEILASKLESRFSMPIVSPPGQTWDYYRRLNDSVQVELLPVPVEDSISQVPDPPEEVLAAFFAKYQNVEAGRDFILDVPLDSPEPGFRQPHRIGFGYVKLDMEKIVEFNATQVTDQEIADYYKDHLAEFEQPALLGEPGATGADRAGGTSASDDPDSNPEGDDEPPTNLNNGEPPADLPQAAAPNAESDPAEAEPAENAETETPAAEGDPASTEDDASDEKPADDSGQFNVADDEEAEVEAQAAVTSESADPVASEAPLAADETAENPDPATTPEPAAEAEPAADAEPATPAEPAATAAPGVKYQPLEQVSEEIRRTLARRPELVTARREELLRPIIEALRTYAGKLSGWESAQELRAEDAPTAAKPEFPDIKQMAEDAGLEYATIEPISVLEFVDDPLGRSFVLTEGRRTEQLFAHAFSGRMQDFRAQMSEDAEGNAYAVWQSEDKPAFVPELKNIRQQVVRTWKLLQARSLAKLEAERLAEAARKSNQPLREYFAADTKHPLIITEPFTWLTYGPVPGGQLGRAPRLSTIDGVPSAGPEFMEAISKLEENQIGIAVNHPQTVYYVARIARHDVPLATLRKRFLDLAEVAAAQNLARRDLYFSVVEGLRESIVEEARLDWIRQPAAQMR